MLGMLQQLWGFSESVQDTPYSPQGSQAPLCPAGKFKAGSRGHTAYSEEGVPSRWPSVFIPCPTYPVQ